MMSKIEEEQPQETWATILFKNRQILNERPEGMPYKDYKRIRTHQTKLLKRVGK